MCCTDHWRRAPLSRHHPVPAPQLPSPLQSPRRLQRRSAPQRTHDQHPVGSACGRGLPLRGHCLAHSCQALGHPGRAQVAPSTHRGPPHQPARHLPDRPYMGKTPRQNQRRTQPPTVGTTQMMRSRRRPRQAGHPPSHAKQAAHEAGRVGHGPHVGVRRRRVRGEVGRHVRALEADECALVAPACHMTPR